jgi:hypothetical protein
VEKILQLSKEKLLDNNPGYLRMDQIHSISVIQAMEKKEIVSPQILKDYFGSYGLQKVVLDLFHLITRMYPTCLDRINISGFRGHTNDF